MRFVGEPVVSRGVNERRFDIDVDGETVPGIRWTPEDVAGTRPLILIGHGGSQHKRSPNVLALARRLVRHVGFAAAAIDAPGHGERVPGGTELTLADIRQRDRGDPEAAQQRMRQGRNEWKQTLTALKHLDDVGDGPTGYWGLSMGTIIGLPFVASEPRIDCAVLGLMGIAPGHKPRSATSLEIPVLFMVQMQDELVPTENAYELFAAIGSKHKTMHVNPGVHAAVPAHEYQSFEHFFVRHLKVREPA